MEKCRREAAERITAQLELGTKDRAFPTDPKSLRQGVRVVVSTKRAVQLRLAKQICRASLPCLQNLYQCGPEIIWQRPHLLTKVSNQTSPPEAMSRHAVLGPQGEVAEPIQRGARHLKKVAVKQIEEIGVVGSDKREAEIGLAAKVVVEAALRHASRIKNVIDASRGIASFRQVLEPGSYQALARGGFPRRQRRTAAARFMA